MIIYLHSTGVITLRQASINCHWLNEVIQSVESYTHEEILEAELKLKDYDNCLLPEKLKLEASDIKSARKITEMENMLKDILLDRFMRIPSTGNTGRKHKKSSIKSGNKAELAKSKDIDYIPGNKEEFFKSDDSVEQKKHENTQHMSSDVKEQELN